MSGQPVYVVTDGEYDGPVPGKHSMLSFASVAVTAAGDFIGEFEAVLEPLPGAVRDLRTMEFWQSEPKAFAAATANPQPPSLVMPRFVEWVRGLPGQPVFVSHPLALDGLWFDFYLQKFSKERLLEGPWMPNRLFKGAVCLVSFAAGRLGYSGIDDIDYPDAWCGNVPHTHRAIDDARGYAHLLVHLMQRNLPAAA
jgi:hypothetical protein